MACSPFILPGSDSSITLSTLTCCRPLCLPFAIHLRLAVLRVVKDIYEWMLPDRSPY